MLEFEGNLARGRMMSTSEQANERQKNLKALDKVFPDDPPPEIRAQASEKIAGKNEFSLEIFKSVQEHELELNKATSAFEHAALRPGIILNGGAAVAFVTLLGAVKNVPPSFHTPLAAEAIMAWGVGLFFAALATAFGWISQRNYTRYLKKQRSALEYYLAGVQFGVSNRRKSGDQDQRGDRAENRRRAEVEDRRQSSVRDRRQNEQNISASEAKSYTAKTKATWGRRLQYAAIVFGIISYAAFVMGVYDAKNSILFDAPISGEKEEINGSSK